MRNFWQVGKFANWGVIFFNISKRKLCSTAVKMNGLQISLFKRTRRVEVLGRNHGTNFYAIESRDKGLRKKFRLLFESLKGKRSWDRRYGNKKVYVYTGSNQRSKSLVQRITAHTMAVVENTFRNVTYVYCVRMYTYYIQDRYVIIKIYIQIRNWHSIY